MTWERDYEWEHVTHQVMLTAGVSTGLPEAYRSGKLHALVSREPTGKAQELRWHVSVSHEGRIPTWPEVARAAHELRPGVPMVIGIPPRSWWINVNATVLHLFELCDEVLIDQWQFEGRGDKPT